MKQIVPERKARIIAMEGVQVFKPRKLKEAMDPKALEEAMKQRVPERMARIIALPPGSKWGDIRKRKDGTIVKYKKLPLSSRPCYEAMDPKPKEEAMKRFLPEKKARIIAMPPGSSCYPFYKRKNGTIVKYKWLPRSSFVGYKPRKLKEAMDPKAIEEAMKQRVPERMARIIAMLPGSAAGHIRKRKDGTIVKYKDGYELKGPKKEAMDPKALEEAMSNMQPKKKARIIALTPGESCGDYRKRKDGTIVKYKKLPRSSPPCYEAMDPKAMVEAMKQLAPEKKARIIAMPPGSSCYPFYKRKDGTIVKYQTHPARPTRKDGTITKYNDKGRQIIKDKDVTGELPPDLHGDDPEQCVGVGPASGSGDEMRDESDGLVPGVEDVAPIFVDETDLFALSPVVPVSREAEEYLELFPDEVASESDEAAASDESKAICFSSGD